MHACDDSNHLEIGHRESDIFLETRPAFLNGRFAMTDDRFHDERRPSAAVAAVGNTRAKGKRRAPIGPALRLVRLESRKLLAAPLARAAMLAA
jgi:hypothetical protein